MVYLEVIYETKTKRNIKKYELKDYAKAFNIWYKNNGVIWLRDTKYGYNPYFDKNKAKHYFVTKEGHYYATKEDYFQKFVEWLKDQIKMWNNGEGLELIK